MSDVYQSISTVWSQFPIEFVTSTFNNDIKTWKAKFENRSYLFDKYITKLVIIGDVSTGKSTLINTFLGKEYLGVCDGHGTKAFYYCSLSEKNYEYFTMNRSNNEIRDMSILIHPSDYHSGRNDDINHKTVFKVYVKHDESRILERKTVIVDCPGFGQEREYKEEIERHCYNSDLYIFIFQMGKAVTRKQIDYVMELRRKYNNPTCFFVINKCDKNEFNNTSKKTWTEEFYELFEPQDRRQLRSNNDPLYFISSIKDKANNYEDFHRLKKDIMIYKDTNFIRYTNYQSTIPDEVNGFCRRLNSFVFDEENSLTSLSRKIGEFRNHRVNSSTITNHVDRCINDYRNNLCQKRIFEIILREINDYDRTCYKENAPHMIRTIENNFRPKIIKFVENNLIHSCIDEVNQRIMQINKSSEYRIMTCDRNEFQMSTDLLVIPIYKNIEDIFWFFEFGDKSMKIKLYYSEFIESRDNKNEIAQSVRKLCENQFQIIRRRYDNILETYNRNLKERENELQNNLEIIRSNFNKLKDYRSNITSNLIGISSFI